MLSFVGRDNFQFMKGDIRNQSALEKGVRNIEAVIHLVALGLAQLANLEQIFQRISPWYADILLRKPEVNMKLKAALASQFGIETRVAYKPLHRQPIYMNAREFPSADFFSARGLWLPSSTFLKNEDIDYITDALNQVIATLAP